MMDDHPDDLMRSGLVDGQILVNDVHFTLQSVTKWLKNVARACRAPIFLTKIVCDGVVRMHMIKMID
jgi:hypothetical protein